LEEQKAKGYGRTIFKYQDYMRGWGGEFIYQVLEGVGYYSGIIYSLAFYATIGWFYLKSATYITNASYCSYILDSSLFSS
jgi:hypothetical protein